MVFNQLFQFSNKKRRKQQHKLSGAKEIRIFCEHQTFSETAKTREKARNFLPVKVSSPKVETRSFFLSPCISQVREGKIADILFKVLQMLILLQKLSLSKVLEILLLELRSRWYYLRSNHERAIC